MIYFQIIYYLPPPPPSYWKIVSPHFWIFWLFLRGWEVNWGGIWKQNEKKGEDKGYILKEFAWMFHFKKHIPLTQKIISLNDGQHSLIMIYQSCQQIRAKKCSSVKISLFVSTKPEIDNCNNFQLGCFNFDYTGIIGKLLILIRYISICRIKFLGKSMDWVLPFLWTTSYLFQFFERGRML